MPSEISIEDIKGKIKHFEIGVGSVKSDLLKAFPLKQTNYRAAPLVKVDQEHLLTWLRDKTAEFHPMPMAIRWFKVSAWGISAVIESAPRMQNVHFYPAMKLTSAKEKAIQVKIPVPWVQMGVNVSMHYDGDGNIVPNHLSVPFIAFTDRPMGPSPSDKKNLYAPLLPNTFIYDFDSHYKTGSTCYEANIPPGIAKKLSLSGIFSYMVNDYWNSTFNFNLPVETKFYSKFMKETGGTVPFEKVDKDSAFQNLSANARRGFSNIQAQVLYKWSTLGIEDIMDLEKYGFPLINNEAAFYKMYSATHNFGSHFRPFDTYDAAKVQTKNLGKVVGKNGGWQTLNKSSVDEYASSIQALHAVNHLLDEMYSTPNKPAADSYVAKGMIGTPPRGKAGTKKLTITYNDQAGLTDRNNAATVGLPPEKIVEAANLWMSHFNSGDKALPPGLRYWNPVKQMIVFERPPGTRRIYWDKNYKEGASRRDISEKKFFDIWLPWTQYWVTYNSKRAISGVFVTTASSSLSKPSTEVGLLPLSNIYAESRVCLPNSVTEHEDLTSLILSAYNMVWSSNYNMDLSDAVATFVNSLHEVRDDMKRDYPEDWAKLVKLIGHDQGHGLVSKFLKIMSECNPENIMLLWPKISPVIPRDAGVMHPTYNASCRNCVRHLAGCECKVTDHVPFTAAEMAKYLTNAYTHNWINNQLATAPKDKREPITGIFLKYANTYASKMLH